MDDWSINPDDPVPIGEQIGFRIFYAIARGVYQPGDKLPAVREIAARRKVNPNTVSKAYTGLEREGVVVSRRGSGTFIADAPPPGTARQRMELLRPLLTRVAVEARQLGLDSGKVAEVLCRAWREIGEE